MTLGRTGQRTIGWRRHGWALKLTRFCFHPNSNGGDTSIISPRASTLSPLCNACFRIWFREIIYSDSHFDMFSRSVCFLLFFVSLDLFIPPFLSLFQVCSSSLSHLCFTFSRLVSFFFIILISCHFLLFFSWENHYQSRPLAFRYTV